METFFQRLTNNNSNGDNDDINDSTIAIYDTDIADPVLLHKQLPFTEEQINEMPIINASRSPPSTPANDVSKKKCYSPGCKSISRWLF